MKTDIMQFGFCYAIPQVASAIHPILFHKENLILYPERAMSLYKAVNYLPFVGSVITENPYIISCYPRERVRIWDKDKGWISPSEQTYGASETIILSNVLGVHQSIPSCLYDGGKQLDKQIKKCQKEYTDALEYNFKLIANNSKTYEV